MATTRASSVCTSVHMVRMYTWPRTETNQRTSQSTNQPARSVNKDNDIATTTTRPTPNHARHATPTRPRHLRPARLAVPKTPLVCVFRKRLFLFLFLFLHFLPCSVDVPSALLFIFLSLSLSHLAPRTVSLPSFLFSGSLFLPRVT